MCPGTAGGEFDFAQHKFKNQNCNEVYLNMLDSMALMRKVNPKIKFILTVSPVPLTATNSGKHVAIATMESKSVLRAAAGQLANEFDYVDYFPSYEIINSPIYKGAFFEPNQRSVNPYGVKFVMDSFFKCLKNKYGIEQNTVTDNGTGNSADEVCEEALLGAFGKQ
jgi:hypothetical protein